MANFKYRALAKAPIWNWKLEMEELKADYLRPIADAFGWNFVRSATAVKFPAWIALEALREQLWLDYANVQAGHKLNPDLTEFRQEPESDSAATTFNALVEQYRKIPNIADLLDNIGVEYIERRLSISDQQSAKLGVEAMFSTTVIDAWATFETLASDLWVAAVDKGPKEIANKVSISTKLEKIKDNITPVTVHKVEFDSRTQFGSWLRAVGRVSFRSLERIRVYYSEAFGTEVLELFDKVEDGYIFALSEFRNALIHNAGRADEQFVKGVARFPEFRGINDKDELRLNGELVAKLRLSAKNLGQALVQFVDGKLIVP